MEFSPFIFVGAHYVLIFEERKEREGKKRKR
jgi:hypothetical protein